MDEDAERLAAREAAKARFDETCKLMAASIDWPKHDAKVDLLGRMMFGVPGKELTEDQEGSVIAWMCKDRSLERLHRGAVRDAIHALARLTLLYAVIEDRLDHRFQESEYPDLMVEAHVAGTVAGMSAVCERLEASWHDDRLTKNEGIEAVEAVEALRRALTRMEACGLTGMSAFDVSAPSSYPARP